MNFQQFQNLGDEIRTKFSRHNFDEQALPDLAAETLSRVDLDSDFRLDQLADFLIETKIEQQPSLEFSNLPPVVYRCEDFYIELLIWTDATTTIHQHSFSGAFRVLVGSSFHSIYDFNERERISSRLLIGDARLKGAEVLKTGDVRPIRPGRTGLLHALFHLDRPSVTVVVRNYSEPWAQPQYQLDPPHVAFDAIKLRRDSKVRLLGRLLTMAAALNPKDAVELFVSKGIQLDFPRLFMVLQENYGFLNADADWLLFIEAAREAHGPLAEHLEQMVRSRKRTASLVHARQSVKDPELRFFLALLLNLPSRTWIYRVIQENHSGTSPEILCCQWLMRLADEESLSNAFFELAQKAKLGGDILGARLKAAISCGRVDTRAQTILHSALTAVSPQEFEGIIKGTFGDNVPSSDISDTYERIRQLTELEPLFLE